MATHKVELEDHIKTLEEFETLYGAFLVERGNRERDWSGEEWARRERELKELAPQVEVAMFAAGERRWDEGPVRLDLPSRILRFVDRGDGIDHAEQGQILERLPTNIGALKGKLRRVSGMGLKEESAEQAPPPPTSGASEGTGKPRYRRMLAWVADQAGKIVVTVIGGLILALLPRAC